MTQNNTGDLWSYVDRLTRTRRQRLTRQAPGQKKPVIEWITVDSLLDQLTGMIGSTTTSDGGASKSTGSAAPLNVVAATLLDEMSRTVVGKLRHAGLTPRITTERAAPITSRPRITAEEALARSGDTLEPQQAGLLAERAARGAADARARADAARLTHDLAADLRQLATHIADHDDAEYVDIWVRKYRSWVAKVETALVLDDDSESITTHGIRYGDRRFCPACGADKVTREEDGELFRDPALVASFRDGQLLHVTCRACEAGWWRGEDLDELSQEVAFTTYETRPAPAQPDTAACRPLELDGERRRLIHLLDIPVDDHTRSTA